MAAQSPAQSNTVERVMRAALPGWAVLAAVLAAGTAQAQPASGSSGPQTAVPGPAPSGQADVPGGSSRNGVITPPSTGGTMPVVHPPTATRMPILKPPGTTHGTRRVQPK